MAATLLNPFVKGKVRPKRLLGWSHNLTGMPKEVVKEHYRQKYGDKVSQPDEQKENEDANGVG